jgi:hemoglobin-like flavoprotein
LVTAKTSQANFFATKPKDNYHAIDSNYWFRTSRFINSTWLIKSGVCRDIVFGQNGREAVIVAKRIIRDFSPWDWEWAKDMELADENGWLIGRFPPTIRQPVGMLPSGRVVMPVGDTSMTFDPIGGQGANNGSKMARFPLSISCKETTMTPEQIILVQTSFGTVLPFADEMAEAFYLRLFELDLSLRPMFKNDMELQKRKLISSLVMVIKNLQRPDVFLHKVQNLGRNHVGYGVQPHHYHLVGQALLYAIEQRVGSDYSPDVEAAWVAAYALLANVMQTAALEKESAL